MRIYFWKINNEINAWIDNHPQLIHPSNVKDSVFVKINVTLVKKPKHLLQISVREIHTGMILPSSEGDFSGARTIDGNVCIGDASLRKYIKKYIKPMISRNNITCECETCIMAMLLQSDINKWRISQLWKLDKLYINSGTTRILERSNNYFIQYKTQIFPNDSHIHLRDCDAA